MISETLKVVLGFISNKARDRMADYLGNGDPSDEALRDILVRDLKHIKDTLESLSRKDLLSAVDFFELGVNAMQLCGDEYSDQRKQSAEEYFVNAIEYSTQAFRNDSLGTKQRILAMKIHISSLLLKLSNDPKLAFHLCLKLIKKLHDLPQVTKAFGSEFSDESGRTRLFRRWHKKQRADIIEGVKGINDAVGEFAARFNLQLDEEWPVVRVVREKKEDITFFFHRSVENVTGSPGLLRRKSWFEAKATTMAKRKEKKRLPIIKGGH